MRIGLSPITSYHLSTKLGTHQPYNRTMRIPSVYVLNQHSLGISQQSIESDIYTSLDLWALHVILRKVSACTVSVHQEAMQLVNFRSPAGSYQAWNTFLQLINAGRLILARAHLTRTLHVRITLSGTFLRTALASMLILSRRYATTSMRLCKVLFE